MIGDRLWVFGAVAAIVAIGLVGWLLGISPKLAEASVAQAERVNVESMNTAQSSEIAALKEKKENFEDLQAQLDELGLIIPDGVRAEDFVDSLWAAASAAGVEIKKITVAEGGAWGVSAAPGAPAPTSSDDSDSPPIPTAPEGVYTVAVTIETRGDVFAFSGLAQKGQRLFVIADMTFDADEDFKGVINGYLFVVRDPKASPPAENVEPAPAPTDTATPTPDPTETPSP